MSVPVYKESLSACNYVNHGKPVLERGMAYLFCEIAK